MIKRFIQFLLIGSLAYGGWHYRDQIEALYREFKVQRASRGEAQAIPDPERYAVLKEELELKRAHLAKRYACLLYTSPSPRDRTRSRMPSSA